MKPNTVLLSYTQPVIEYAQYLASFLGSPIPKLELFDINGTAFLYGGEKYRVNLCFNSDEPLFPPEIPNYTRNTMDELLVSYGNSVAQLFIVFAAQNVPSSNFLHYVILDFDKNNFSFAPKFTGKNSEILGQNQYLNLVNDFISTDKFQSMSLNEKLSCEKLIAAANLQKKEYDKSLDSEIDFVQKLLDTASPARFVIKRSN